MPIYDTATPVVTPKRVLELTAPDGNHVIECFSLETFAFLGFVKAFDPEAHDGRGSVDLTKSKRAALRFKDFLSAVDCWKMTSQKRPRREDGKPNRPLTAFTVQITQFDRPHAGEKA